MELKTYVAQDDSGNVLSAAIARILNRGTDDLADGFLDSAGAALSFPISTDSNGVLKFQGPNGAYDLQFEKDGKKSPKFSFQNFDVANTVDIKYAASFDALRTKVPEYDGQMCLVRSYYAGKNRGGGVFVGYKRTNSTSTDEFIDFTGTMTDDGGFMAAGAGFYWHRHNIDVGALTVFDFGAYGDGVTDDQPAVKRMYEFMFGSIARAISGGKSPTIGIQFPPGKYFVKPGDYTTYGNAVDPSNATQVAENPTGYLAAGEFTLRATSINDYGRMCNVTIVSDKTDAPVFSIYHRRFHMYGIIWDGQQTRAQNTYNANSNPTGTNRLVGATDHIYNDTATNKQPFIKNICHGGAYMNIKCFVANNIGGPALDFMDSIDAKMDQWYASKPAAPVLKMGWSNQATGVWDHSTAFEITNGNVSSHCAPVLYMPRSTQGLMRNCWYEHGVAAFDLNNGSWLFEAVSVEDCTQNPVMYRTKLVCDQFSAPTGNKLDDITAPTDAGWASYLTNPDGSAITDWINDFELGSVRRENYGTIFNQPIRYNWRSGVIHGFNNTAAAIWVKVGSFGFYNKGEIWELDILSKNGYSSATGLKPNQDGTPGKTILTIQRGDGTATITNMQHSGFSGVAAAQFRPRTNEGSGVGELWIKINSYSTYAVNVTGNGDTRFDRGQPGLFKPSGLVQTDDPGLTAIVSKASLHNGLAGIGAIDSNISLQTEHVKISDYPIDVSDSPRVMRVLMNGIYVAMQYRAFQPRITTQPTAKTLAVGATLTLTMAADDAYAYQWQKSTDGTTWVNIAGATSVTYTKASVTVDDAGQYRCVAKGFLYSIDTTNTTNAKNTNAVTVTVS